MFPENLSVMMNKKDLAKGELTGLNKSSLN